MFFGKKKSKKRPLTKEGEHLAACGHLTKIKDKIVVFGEEVILSLRFRHGKIEYCHRCIEKMTIRCAWCGRVIIIGDPITLYSPGKNFIPPKYAVKYSNHPPRYVGCMRLNCASTGMDRAGFWSPPGKVCLTPGIYEKIITDLVNGGSGAMIVDVRKL